MDNAFYELLYTKQYVKLKKFVNLRGIKITPDTFRYIITHGYHEFISMFGDHISNWSTKELALICLYARKYGTSSIFDTALTRRDDKDKYQDIYDLGYHMMAQSESVFSLY